MGDHAGFVAGLRAERESFHALCKVLESEQACLVKGDVDSLLEIAPLKSERVDRLQHLEQQRIGYLDSIGLGTGQTAMTDWLAAHAGTERSVLAQLWEELVLLAAEARSLNDINGKLITTRLAHSQAAMAALQLSARAQNIYGPDGQAAFVAGQRDLGRA
jgi:flagellar biosynthesis protein FlgN